MIFDKLLGKKEKKPISADRKTSIEFDEIPEWMAQEKEAMDLESDELVKSSIHKISDSFDRLEALVDELEEREIDQEVVKKLENIAITSKRKYCEGMRIVLSKRIKGVPIGYKELREYLSNIEEVVGNINKTHQTHGRYLGITFQSSLKEMGKELKAIMTITGLLRAQAKRLEEVWTGLNNIEEVMGEYRLTHQGEMDIRVEGIESEKMDITERISSLEKRRNGIVEGDKYRSHTSLTLGLEEVNDEEQTLNAEIYNALGPVKRMLKKTHKAIEDGRLDIGGADLGFLEEFIEHPALSFISDTDDLSKTREVMNTLIRAIDSGVIKEKRAKMEKSYSIAKKVVSGGMNDQKLSYVELERRRMHVQNDLDGIDLNELKQTDRDIDQLTHRLNSLNEELEHTKDISDELALRREKAKNRLKKTIESYNPEIAINL